jgi:FAD dependent oxidoreductase
MAVRSRMDDRPEHIRTPTPPVRGSGTHSLNFQKTIRERFPAVDFPSSHLTTQDHAQEAGRRSGARRTAKALCRGAEVGSAQWAIWRAGRGWTSGTTRLPLLHWFEIQTNPERFSKDCPVFIWEVSRKSILYGFPLVGELGAGLKVANEESEGIVDPDSVDRIVSDADKAKMYETYVRPFLPDLGPRSIKTAVCLYTNAPGRRFVIDRHPEHERVIFASPCSGHGFKYSAAIGEALADRLRNRPAKVDLSPFDLRHIS